MHLPALLALQLDSIVAQAGHWFEAVALRAIALPLELIYLIFCDASRYCVHVDRLIYLADLDRLDMYDWGGASYAWLLYDLDSVVQQGRCSYVGLYPLLTVSFNFC